MASLTWLGHASFLLTSDTGKRIYVDPFLTGNPKTPESLQHPTQVDVIALTHGHGDHLGDTVSIAKRTGATVVAITELAGELADDGLQNVRNPNLGGTETFEWGSVKLVPAWHTSTTPKGTVNTPAGMIVTLGGVTVYHLGDTALFGDLELIGRRHPIDVALICIGGHFTMDRHDAAEAARMIGARQVIPCHYDTFPAIETDVEAFKGDVETDTSSQVVVLAPGETHTL
jgi:L-ascorbate metabolism protein UlaG (beta-lactamase superfamily)